MNHLCAINVGLKTSYPNGGAISYRNITTLLWIGNRYGSLKMTDQTLLLTKLKEIDCREVETVELVEFVRIRFGGDKIGLSTDKK